jgi:peptide/nickel transport system permease protein
VVAQSRTLDPAVTEESETRRVWRKALRNRSAVVGGAICLFLILVAISAPLLAPYHPTEGHDVANSLRSPSNEFPLGTDNVGRDNLSRIIYGTRISLSVGVVVSLISVTVGSVLGLISGFAGGKIDAFLNGAATIFMAFPSLLFAIAVMAAVGPSIFNVFWTLGLVNWPTVYRLVRGETISLRETDFVEAARALGSSPLRIVFRHILPNAMGPVIVVGTLGMAGAILAEATLSFLGLGVQPPTPAWGSMLAMGRDFVFQAWWMLVFPALAIFLTVLGINLLGDGLRDVLDPRLRK